MRLTTIEMMVYGKNIADFIHDIIEDDKYDVSIEWKDYYTQGTDPFACQTQSGFFLEEYNGMPCYLYTPIGRWKLMDRTTAKGKDWNKINFLVVICIRSCSRSTNCTSQIIFDTFTQINLKTIGN